MKGMCVCTNVGIHKYMKHTQAPIEREKFPCVFAYLYQLEGTSMFLN